MKQTAILLALLPLCQSHVTQVTLGTPAQMRATEQNPGPPLDTKAATIQANREFQVRLDSSVFSPLSKMKEHLVPFLVNELPRKVPALKVDDGPAAVELQNYVRYDTIDMALQNSNCTLQVRNKLDGSRDTSLTLKLSHLDFDMMAENEFDARKKYEENSERKVEVDLYPRFTKFAKSVKLEGMDWNVTFQHSKELAKFFKGQLVDDLFLEHGAGSDSVRLIATESFYRVIAEFNAEFHGQPLQFVLSAEYKTMKDAQDAQIPPEVVELSYRMEVPISVKDLKKFWFLYGHVQEFQHSVLK